MAAEIRRVVNRKRVPPLQPSQFMQEIGFSVVTPILLPFLPLPSLFLLPPPAFIFRVCSCHPAEVVSRTPLCARSTFLSGLNTSRPDYRTESNSFKIRGEDPLKSRLQIRFRASVPTVCVLPLRILLQEQLFRSRSESPTSSKNSKQKKLLNEN